MSSSVHTLSSRIGVSAWTFHKRFFAGTMDYPQFFAATRGAGLQLVELNSPFFLSQDPAYISSLKQAADAYDITLTNLAIDDWEYDLSASDEENRLKAVQRTVAWMDIAVALGCEHIRNNTGGESLHQCQKSLLTLASQAQARGCRLAIEAHGGFSSDAEEIVPLVEVVRKHYPKHIGLIPDFGNVSITPKLDRSGQIAAMAPYAFLVHPKMHDFDDQGQQPDWDTAHLVEIVQRSGFQGAWIIEFEGEKEDFEGLRKSITLLRNCLSRIQS